jgi:hypothetical protein
MGFTAQSTLKCYYSSNSLTNQFGVVACELHLMGCGSGSIPMYSIFVFFGPVFLGGAGRPPGFLVAAPAAILEACLGGDQAIWLLRNTISDLLCSGDARRSLSR